MYSIPSPSPSVENSNYWGESLLEIIRQNFAVFKCLLTMPCNVLPLHLKQTFPPIIWIFTEGKADGIKSRLPYFRVWFPRKLFFFEFNLKYVLWPFVTVHTGTETIQEWKLFAEIRYLLKNFYFNIEFWWIQKWIKIFIRLQKDFVPHCEHIAQF